MNNSHLITKSSELLRAAKAVISNPRHFTTGVLARDTDGHSVMPDNEKAVCFCSVGALSKVTPPTREAGELNDQAFIYLIKVVKPLNYIGVADYSDSHTHAEVMAMWDAAIALAVADETADHQADVTATMLQADINCGIQKFHDYLSSDQDKAGN